MDELLEVGYIGRFQALMAVLAFLYFNVNIGAGGVLILSTGDTFYATRAHYTFIGAAIEHMLFQHIENWCAASARLR